MELGIIQTESDIQIKISDDGIGINPKRLKENKSFGLLGIRERVLAMRGEMDISDNEGIGTKIIINIPTKIKDFNNGMIICYQNANRTAHFDATPMVHH